VYMYAFTSWESKDAWWVMIKGRVREIYGLTAYNGDPESGVNPAR